MLYLKLLDETACNDYAARILPDLIKRILQGQKHKGTIYKLSPKAKDILLPKWNTKKPDSSIIQKLLTSPPEILDGLNQKLEDRLFALPKRSKPTKKALENIFHYDGVFVADKPTGYWLAKLIGRNTCTYCNRQYVFTIESMKDSGDIRYVARSVFDHWFAKSDYPLLSLSIYNLIPSCTICNSSVKGRTPMRLETHIHPYVPETKSDSFSFRVTKKVSEISEWALIIERTAGSKIDKTIKDFALEEVYALHSELEVKDIMDFNEAYELGYINNIIDTMFANNMKGLTKKDVYRILFGVEFDSEKFLDRPFCKLKRDILEQIGVTID